MLKKILGPVLLLVAVFAFAGVVWGNRYAINDWARLRNYTPSAEVTQLADQSGMNDYGRRLFYINDPKISDRTTFNEQCTVTEQTIVLGCYTGRNIYVFDVQDTKLNGVEEVTAAHEMLHAAYLRLSGSEKKYVDGLLQAAYLRVKNADLEEIMAGYAVSEPGQENNELHSILGTEYLNLGPELEAYYGKYFSDRAKVVTLASNYKKIFDTINNQVEKYDADLSLRKSEITRREEALAEKSAKLESQKAQMQALLQAGRNNEYNAQVTSFNNGITSYNNEIAAVKKIIDEYNAIVEQRNSLTVQQQGLAESLDSRLDTIKN